MGKSLIYMALLKKLVSKIPVGVKASVIYTIASLLSRGMAIITVPIFTRLMPPDQIGVVNIFNSWQSMLSAFATLALTSGGYFVALKEFDSERDQYMSSVLTLTSLVALIMTAVYLTMPDTWNSQTGLNFTLFSFMLVGFFVKPATEFWLGRQRYEYNYKLAGSLSILSSILGTVISVIAVVYANSLDCKNLGEVRLYSGLFVTYTVAGVLWLYIMAKGRRFYDKQFWKLSLTLSIPLIGNSIASQILSVSDRTMIGRMVGNREVGLYSILYSGSSISLILWNAINSSFVPFLFENVGKKEKQADIKRISTQLLFAYGLGAVFITVVAPEIVKILATKEYYEAVYIMPPIAAGVFFTSVSNMYSNMLIYYKKTQYIMVSSIIAAIVNLVLNYYCIRIWGYEAAAYTTLIAYVILAVVQASQYRKIHFMVTGDNTSSVYEDRKIGLIAIAVVVLCMSCIKLYSYTELRYTVIAISIIASIYYRKQIYKIVKFR